MEASLFTNTSALRKMTKHAPLLALALKPWKVEGKHALQPLGVAWSLQALERSVPFEIPIANIDRYLPMTLLAGGAAESMKSTCRLQAQVLQHLCVHHHF